MYFALRLSSDSQIISLGISLPLLFLYNAKIKNYPLIGNIIVSIIIGLSFIYAGVVFENVKPLIVPSLLAFGLTLIREVVKDIADFKGDEAIVTSFCLKAWKRWLKVRLKGFYQKYLFYHKIL